MNTIIIHRPELTAEERARRMEESKRAAVNLALAAEKERIKRNGKQTEKRD